MSRDGSGNYTLPAGNPVTTATTISSSWANTTLADLASEMQDSLSRSGKGGMLAPLQFANGAVGAPGIAWSSEATSGLYRVGAGDFRATVLGAAVFRFGSASNQSYLPLTLNGALTITTGGANITGSVSVTGSFSATTAITFPDGSIANCGMGFTSEVNSGFYRPGANEIRCNIAGTNRWRATNTQDLAVNRSGDWRLVVDNFTAQSFSGLMTFSAGIALGTQNITGNFGISGTPVFAAGANLGTGTFSGNAVFSGNLTFNGTSTFGGAPVFSAGATLGTGTFSGNATFSGNLTLSGAPVASAAITAGDSSTRIATTAFVQSEQAFGGLYDNNNSGISTSGVWTKLIGWSARGSPKDVTEDTANSRLTATNAGTYLCIFSANGIRTAGTGALSVTFAINGTRTTQVQINYDPSANSTEQLQMSAQFLATLAASDYVEVEANCAVGDTFDLYYKYFTIVRVA